MRHGSERGLPFAILAPIGLAVVAGGVRGVLIDSARTHPPDFVKWFAGAAVVHDALLAPAVMLAGVLVSRLRPVIRRPVQAALIASAVIALYSAPLVRGYGRRPDNPTLQPGGYTTGLLATIAVVWAAAAAWGVIAAVRGRSPSRRR